MNTSSAEARPPRLLYAVTASMSTCFYRGRLSYLRDRGFDMHFVSSPGPELDQTGVREGVTTHALPMHREIALLADVVALFRAWRLLRRLKPDIVDAATPKASLIFLLAAAACGVPCRVYSLFGLRLETTCGRMRWLLTQLERVACACAHRCLCISPSLRQRAIELGLASPDKFVVIGVGSEQGISADKFAPSPAVRQQAEQLRRELGIEPSAPVVGFVGRLVRDKGVAELVEAYFRLKPRFPSLVLLLVGQYEEGDPVDPRTRRLIESTSGIIAPGQVDNVVPYYQIMDVLASPTYREGFGTVSLEASAVGKPVVTTNATGARDAVVDGKTGLIVPVGDSDALAKALGRVLENPELARQMGEAGRQRVIAEFPRERIWQGVEELYRTLYEEKVKAKAERVTYFLKRPLDICLSAFGLLVLSPLLAAVAFLVRITAGRPVLFVQERPGLHSMPFKLVKFRTMRDGPGTDAERLTSFGRFLRRSSIDELPELRDGPGTDAERLTSFGRFLRRSSIDELPEFWNVLKGDMSLVGPRPLLLKYLDRYTPEQARRHEVKPGITGWAQVNGRNAITWEQKFALDVWYVDHQSLWLDIRILALTIWKVLRREGISQQGQATMEEFRGSAGVASRPPQERR
jgi:lipopolysaccharide/colanic/teichoic acid biosynthesis glycosyltransferase